MSFPPGLTAWLRGSIDAHAQRKVETWSQFYLIALTIVSFLLSYVTRTILFPLEVFSVGLLILIMITVPPWPFLKRNPVKYLPPRGPPVTKS